MLREVKNARVERRLLRYVLVLADEPVAAVPRRDLQAAETQPVPLLTDGDRTYWAFEQRIWWEDDDLCSQDVLALVRERQRRAARTLERAHAALAGEAAERRREPIPRAVRLAVFERDGGRCVECGSSFDIQYDHVIPLALGGANTVQNLQILCAPCNQAKGATLG
ncbi:MAG TPA: HNH endonuclease signature motif containing protein [Solirubrobacteraceae bacterium]|nr:HNH endonuclease signature motif containing protein [Solirubrobacteraceae bacterium]